MLCGSAFKNKGVQPLLDAVVDYLPSPLDRGAIKGSTTNGEEISSRRTTRADVSLLAFKIMDDPFVGTLTFARIYSGTSKAAPACSIRPRTRRSGSAACC